MKKVTRRIILGSAVLSAAAAYFGWVYRWDRIIIHHSGGPSGSLELLRQVHRERQAKDPIDMIPYHFVIGNGRGMGLGEVAPTKRAEYGVWGAHVKGMSLNLRSLGVCLIGNFEKQEVPEEQYQALVKLVRGLRQTYAIPLDKVHLHREAPGQSTLCPGRHFPKERLMREIA